MSKQLLDFYFSAKHLKHLQRIKSKGCGVFFKNQKYTECVTHGMMPLSLDLYDDLIFLGTGTLLKDVENGFNYF